MTSGPDHLGPGGHEHLAACNAQTMQTSSPTAAASSAAAAASVSASASGGASSGAAAGVGHFLEQQLQLNQLQLAQMRLAASPNRQESLASASGYQTSHLYAQQQQQQQQQQHKQSSSTVSIQTGKTSGTCGPMQLECGSSEAELARWPPGELADKQLQAGNCQSTVAGPPLCPGGEKLPPKQQLMQQQQQQQQQIQQQQQQMQQLQLRTRQQGPLADRCELVFNRLMALEAFRKLQPSLIRSLCAYAFVERIDKGVMGEWYCGVPEWPLSAP